MIHGLMLFFFDSFVVFSPQGRGDSSNKTETSFREACLLVAENPRKTSFCCPFITSCLLQDQLTSDHNLVTIYTTVQSIKITTN